MAAKLMYIPNDDAQNPSVDHNQWLERLGNHLNEQTNQNSVKVSKVVWPTNKKTLL